MVNGRKRAEMVADKALDSGTKAVAAQWTVEGQCVFRARGQETLRGRNERCTVLR